MCPVLEWGVTQHAIELLLHRIQYAEENDAERQADTHPGFFLTDY